MPYPIILHRGHFFWMYFCHFCNFFPLFLTFFESFVGKSGKTGCHFHHINFGGVKVRKVAKISTYQHFSSTPSFPLFSKKVEINSYELFYAILWKWLWTTLPFLCFERNKPCRFFVRKTTKENKDNPRIPKVVRLFIMISRGFHYQ